MKLSTNIRVFLIVVVLLAVLLLVGKYYLNWFESFNNADKEVISGNVKKYSSLDDTMGQPIGTPTEQASLVGVPRDLGLVQGQGFYPSLNQECTNNDKTGSFMSMCPISNPTFGVATSLLPKDVPESEWAIPDCVKDSLENQNYLSAAQRIGNTTTNGVLRNASQDIRNEIPNPQTPVSVWNSSTIGPDLYKRDIE